MADKYNTAQETKTTYRPKKKSSIWKTIFLSLAVISLASINTYITFIVRTVENIDGWKHQIGHFDECDLNEDYNCGEATHRIKIGSIIYGQYCEEHWNTTGTHMFESIAERSSSKSSPSEAAERDAKIYARLIVEDQLKVPSTADFCLYSEMDATNLEGNRWEITGYVDAENSFGAKLRQNWTVTLTLTSSGCTDYSVDFS